MLSWGGLRFRLVWLALIALVPVFGLFACSAAKNQQTTLELARSRLQSDVLLAAAHQQRLVDRVAQLLGDIASGPSIKDTRIRLCVQYLKNLQSQDAAYANLGVVGLDGKVSCHAMDSGLDVYAGDRPFFQQVLAGRKFSVGEYSTGRASGRPGISFAVPVYSSEGMLNGVAFAALDAGKMAQALAAGPVLDGAQLRLMDRRGTIVAMQPAGAGLQGTPERDAVVLEAAQAQRSGIREAVDANGVGRVYAYAPVGGTGGDGLFLAISAPRDVITAGPRKTFLINLLALLGMTAFGMGCAWWLGGRSIVKPAAAILTTANEIAGGNLAARVRLGPLHRGEFGEIGASFNRMAESLQARQDEVGAALGRVDKERALLDLIINSMSEGVVAVDTGGRFLLFNDTVGKLFSAAELSTPLDEWRRDHELLTLDGETVYASVDRPLTQALRGVTVDNRDVLFRKPGLEDRVLRVSARPLRDHDNQLVGAVAVFNDITDLKAAESFFRGQREVLALIASGAPLSQSLEAIVRLIEGRVAGGLCSILLVEGQQLRHGAAAGLPESFMRLIDGLAVGQGGGACGTAAFLKQAVIVEDIATDPLMKDFREIARTYGLQACWSTPVISGEGEVLATFAVYHRTPCKPRDKDLELLETAIRLARIALEHTRAQAALVSSEARFREMADNIQDVFYNRDVRTGRMLYVSPGYERIWGLSCESLYADPKSYLGAVLPEDRPVLKLVDELTAAGKVSDLEYRIISPDGQTRWIRENSYPVFNAAGELERVVGTARDITDRKLADLALDSTNRAMQMLSRSSVALNRIDDEAYLLAEVCRVAVEVGSYRMAWVGYAQDDEARGILPMAHFGHEDGYLSSIKLSWLDNDVRGQGPAGRAIRSGQVQQTGDIAQADHRFNWKAAALQRGYRSALFLPLRDGPHTFGVLGLYAGEVQHFSSNEVKLLQELADNLAFGIGSLRARLERRREQEAARQAAAKVREQASLLDRAQDAIMVRNLDRTLRYWNKGAEHLYGWTAEEVLGKTMDELMYRSPQVLISAMNQTLANDGDWTGELEQLARDGSTVYIEARWTVVRDEHGQVNGVLGINTDIRERKRAHEEILRLNTSLEERVQQRTAQLEFANKQLESFSYSVSHDLRTPLSAIDGFSDLLDKALAKTVSGPQADRSRHYLSRIRAGVSQMGELIDAMLSLAQVSRASLRWETVDLSALALDVLARQRDREPGRVAQLQVEPGLAAQGDPRLLQQVLENLLGNAWKFSAGTARTEITFGQQAGPGGETVYFIRDNGAGFDMAYSEKLFGAFQRLHSPSEFSGTGIGLTTVQRIIARHGGRVWGEAALGRGATFYFTLGAARL